MNCFNCIFNGLLIVQCVNTHFIQQFLNQKYINNIVLYNEQVVDVDYEYYIKLISNEFNSYQEFWFHQWNGSIIPNIHKALIILYEPTPIKLREFSSRICL